MMLIRSKIVLAATAAALALPAAPALADGPSNSADAYASNYSSTSQNATQSGGGYGSGQFLVQAAYTNQEANAYADATQVVIGTPHHRWH